jgi:hypothetical protein
MMWLSFAGPINTFRREVLGLQPIRPGQTGWNMLNALKVRTAAV